MVGPTREQTYQAFSTWYQEEHGTLVGVRDAFEWWCDPGLTCAIAIAGRAIVDGKCKQACDFCKAKREREINDR